MSTYTQKAQRLLDRCNRFSISMAPRHKLSVNKAVILLKKELEENEKKASESEIKDALTILSRIPVFKVSQEDIKL